MAAPLHPSVSRIATVARALRELAADVVFIGGAIAPLLQTRSPLPKVRATLDVDAVIASTTYSAFSTLAERLQVLGFSRDVADTKHVHRWRAPGGIPFDLVPAGEHLGGTGSSCDRLAIETAVQADIEPGLTIRHASAPGFLALKWAAFHDRGADDPFLSHDLEDILALVVSRDELSDEVRAPPPEIRDEIRRGFNWLVASPDYEDLVAANLGNSPQFGQIDALLRERVDAILE
jgi:predicted nucleotidyltransferase